MRLSNKFDGGLQKILSTAFFLVTFIFLQYLYAITLYIPFYMVSMIVILPVAINFLLQLFSCKFNLHEPEKQELEEGTKKLKKFLLTSRYTAKKILYSSTVFYNKIHKVLQIAAVLIAFVLVQILFGMAIFSYTSQYIGLNDTSQFIYPIILAVLFVFAIIIDKWLKYSEGKTERTEAFFHNNRVAFYLAKVSLILLTVGIAIKILDFYDIQRYLYYAFIAIFYYVSVFLLISLVVLFLKKQLLTSSKLIVLLPFAGKDKNDLSVLGFLENNTGITMRGLWSMKLIKQIIPYTIISVAALFWLSTGIVQVEANQEAVVYRMGVLQEETLKPGLHFTLPAPFDQVEYYNKGTVNKVTIGYEPKAGTDNLWTEAHGNQEYRLLLDGGNELVSINLRVEYKIKDLYKYLTVSSSPDSMVEAYAYNLITQKIIKTDLSTLLAVERNEFALNFRKELEASLDKSNVGLEIVNVFLESIHPPLDVAEKYQEVRSTELLVNQTLLQNENDAIMYILATQSDYIRTINEAKAQSNYNIGAATASVAEFMASVAAYEANPEAYRYYKYLDALTNAYGQANLILVGDGIDSSKIILGNLANGSSAGSTVVTTPTESLT